LKDQTTLNKTPLIAITGQPNTGKTTLFNQLSGKKFKTVNYPGSTVEYSISKILSKYAVNANILDSPGIIRFHLMKNCQFKHYSNILNTVRLI